MKQRILHVALIWLLLAGCAGQESVPAPAVGAPASLPQQSANVENRLIPVTAEGAIDWRNPATLTERMAHYGVPGVSIAVIDDYQLAWAKGYGVLEAGGDQPVTNETLFHAGSIAKPVAAAAALALVDRRLLDLDQDVNDRLASWHVPDNQYTEAEKVTLRRLLSHSAGLSDGFPMRSSSDPEYDWGQAGEGEAPVATIQQMLEAEPPAAEGTPTRVMRIPGTAYQYSNLGYGVVQLLMTDVTQQPFAELMAETVLEPLGLASSTFAQPLPASLRARAASEHYVDGRPFADKRHHFPLQAAGGLWTTPSDLARFALELVRARSGASDLLLPQELAVEMLTPQIDVEESFLSDSYGLGFDLGGAGREYHFMHAGGTWGSTALLWVYPEGGQGAVIMTNSASGEGAIRLEILLAIAAEYGWPLAPFKAIDLMVVAAANLFNLLVTVIFLVRPRGWKRFERIAGLAAVALALPLAAAVVLNVLAQREWWFILLPLPLILHAVAELLFDYILQRNWRKSRVLGPFLALYYLGQIALIGYAFLVQPLYGFLTLGTYSLCLAATAYTHWRGADSASMAGAAVS